MRTLLLTLACVGLGFVLAKIQQDRRTAGVTHLMGMEDVKVTDATDRSAIQEAIDSQTGRKVGKIEVVNGTELDFGMMMSGTKRSHKFIFKNVGQADAKIWYQSSTCKCTVGKFTDAILIPGQETEVELEWKAESQFDEFSQTATIGTDCPNQEEIKLAIRGRIGEAYVFEPGQHNYGDFYSNTETVIPVTVYSFEESPLDLTSGSVLDAVLSKKIKVELGEEQHLSPGEIPDKADARHKVDFKIRLLPGIAAGNVNVEIKLARKSTERGTSTEFLVYNVRARCVTPVRVIAGNDYNEMRNVFSLGTAKSSEGLKKNFLIAIRNDDSKGDPNVRIGKTVPSQLKATIGEPKISDTQRIYPITLEIPPGTDPIELDGTFSKDFGKIVIETDLESAPEVPIFIKFRITE